MNDVVRPRVVDTSVLIAALDKDDARNASAVSRLGDPGPCVVPGEVLVESLGVATAKANRQASKALFQQLLSTQHVELSHATDLLEAIKIQAKHPKLSIVDAVGISHALRLGCDLDTFDDEQSRVWKLLRAA